MKNYLIVSLLIISANCWSQTAVPQKADSAAKIFTVVDHMPQFPGGDNMLVNFLQKHLQYPADARTQGIEGVVYLSFVVLTDGTLSDIKILRDIDGGCGDEAVRVVKLMPKWTPGTQNGVPADVQFNLPIRFELSDK